VDDDLRSDLAIRVGLPVIEQRISLDEARFVVVRFATSELREFRGRMGGNLVVNHGLIVDLWKLYCTFVIMKARPPQVIPHPEHPFQHFLPKEVSTHRHHYVDQENASPELAIPGPYRLMAFFAVAKKIPVAKKVKAL
jgi:hypothetical protein